MADEIAIKITARDEASDRARALTKEIRALDKEISEMSRSVAETGKGAGELRALEARYTALVGEQRKARQEAGRLSSELRKTGQVGETSAKKATTAWQKFQKVMGNPLVTMVSTVAITMFARDAIAKFAEVQDARDALSASFGPSGEAMIAWADETAISFNLSSREALNAAQTMAVFGDAAGLAGADLESFAISLTERAAEASSYFGGTTQDAITAFGAALRGEMEPIRKYGVLLDDATLRAEALKMGLIETTSQALTPQQKTLAAYNAVMEQTDRVVGDVARTQDSMANQIKQSQAQMDNFKTSVGETLAVGLKPLVEFLNGALSFFNQLPSGVRSTAVVVGALGAAALVASPHVLRLKASMDAAGISAGAMGKRLGIATLKFTAVAAAIYGVGKAVNSLTAPAADADIESTASALEYWANSGQMAAEHAGNLGQDMEHLDRAMQFMLRPDVIDNVSKFAGGILGLVGIDDTAKIAARDFELLDSAFADLSRRNAPAAARAFDEVERRAADMGITTEELMGLFPQYKTALDGVAGAAGRDADATWRAVTAADALKAAKQGAKRAADALTSALDGVTAAIQRAEAMRAYNDAMKAYVEDPSVETAEAVSAAMVSAADSMDNPRKRAKFVKSAVDDIKTAADGVGLSPDLENALSRAKAEAKELKAAIDLIPTTKTITMYLNKVGQIPTFATGGLVDRSTAGGPVFGAGNGTSDSIPARLSNGEYVVRSAAVKALGIGTLQAINRADSRPVYIAPKMTAPTLPPGQVTPPPSIPAIGEVHVHNPQQGVDVQAEVLWAMRRAERIARERR